MLHLYLGTLWPGRATLAGREWAGRRDSASLCKRLISSVDTHLEPQNSLLFVGTNRAGSETPGQRTSQGFETRVC
jgi:hypothetical protein